MHEDVEKSKLTARSSRKLYPVSDASLTPFQKIAERGSLKRVKLLNTLRGGCDLMQYRDKSSNKNKRLREARILKSLCRLSKTKLIINDDWRLCRRIAADGVHLGKDDARIRQVRNALSSKCVLGVSCYDQSIRAAEALRQGADYVAFGALYDSAIKPNAIKANLKVLRMGSKLCKGKKYTVGIGGINQKNLPNVIRAGARYAAMISAFWTTFE